MKASELKQFEKAVRDRDSWEGVWGEIYDYMLPLRAGFSQGITVGERRDDMIFDETGVVSMAEFANRLQAGLVPRGQIWAPIRPGTDVPEGEQTEIQSQLDPVNALIFDELERSNFYSVVNESIIDLGVGTAALVFDDIDGKFNFAAIPQPEFYIAATPRGDVSRAYRMHNVLYDELPVQFPGIKPIEQEKMGSGADGKVEVIEKISRDWSDKGNVAWDYNIFSRKSKDEGALLTDRFVGDGSNPWITFRWAKSAGESYGRGPAFNALSAVKTCNLTVQLILENASMSIAGMWQSDHNGTVNTDTINLVPGTIIPRLPGTRGLEPLSPGGNFDVAQLILQDMRHNIRKALFNETLGPRQGTPASATEIAERMADLSRLLGPVLDKLYDELNVAIIHRAVFLLKQRGLLELPFLDGRMLKVVVTSPLARAQRAQGIANFGRFSEHVAGTFGPQILLQSVKVEDAVRWLGGEYEIPAALLRSDAEIQQAGAEIAEAAGAAQAAGVDPQAVISAAGGG